MNEMFWRVEVSDEFDLDNFIGNYSRGNPVSLKGCRIFFTSPPKESSSDKKLLLEAVMKSSFTASDVDSIFVDYLNELNINNELIIIDPYFYAPITQTNRLTAYCNRIKNIIGNYSAVLTDIRIVTSGVSRKFCQATKNGVESAIRSLNCNINIYHTTSEDLHDRFWIADNRSKGIVSGTSFNGFGGKYCIIDFLEEDDVSDIITDFSNLSLI